MEEQVYNYLIMNHIGKDNLIKNVDLRKRFNIGSDKSMRKIIQNIREDDDYCLIVGSISGKSGGFYICHTEEEIDDTISNINNRAIQMLYMCKKLREKKKRTIDEQH